jgi:hypothetical protein
MAGRTIGWFVVGIVAGALTATGVVASDGPLTGWLDGTLGLDAGERAALQRGEPVVRVLEASARHEVALGGSVRVETGARDFIALAHDIIRWKAGPAVLQIGRFSEPPTMDAAASLRLDEPDLAALRRCAGRPCDVKLAALAPEEFRDFDWRAPDAVRRAEDAIRRGLVRHARKYLTEGDRALMEYAERQTSLAEEMRGLMRATARLDEQAPGLAAYLAEFPQRALPGAQSSIYWARESFGLKPVLSLYHVVVLPETRTGAALLVSKQFYASRYFDVSLDVLVALDDPADPGGNSAYVVQVARSRTDSLRGFWGGMKRRAVTSEARGALAKMLLRFARLASEETAGDAVEPAVRR